MVEKVLDWLGGGLCEYTGMEADLPLGGQGKIPLWGPEKVARRWLVTAPDTDEGTVLKLSKELTKEDIIIGVELNPKTLAAMANTYGPKFYMIRGANAGAWMTPAQWFSAKKTDGLALVAIRNKRRELIGGGVHF